jgi:hypothetical protein
MYVCVKVYQVMQSKARTDMIVNALTAVLLAVDMLKLSQSS